MAYDNPNITPEISEPRPRKVISVVSSGGKVIPGEGGKSVEYIDLSEPKGYLTQSQQLILGKSNANGIIFQGCLFQLAEKNDKIWKYTADYLPDIDKRQVITVDIASLAYEHALISGSFGEHVADDSIHLRDGEREMWNQISNIGLSNLSPELVEQIKQWAAEGERGSSRIVFSTHEQFPSVGESEVLYVAEDEHSLYLWDIETYTYVLISGDYSNVKTIDGGGAGDW